MAHAALAAGILVLSTSLAAAQPSPLTGRVTSAEVPMEGVLVTVRRLPAHFSVTAITDEMGRYSFPPSKIEAGHYTVKITAPGYEFDGPNYTDIEQGKPTIGDFSIRKARDGSPPLARITSRGTRAIVTEYDLPSGNVQPHDLLVDARGRVWYSNFGELSLKRFEPRTGKAKTFELPQFRQDFLRGRASLEADGNGNLWLALIYLGGIAKFDKASETFQSWYLPRDQADHIRQLSQTAISHSTVDGKVWLTETSTAGVHRLDLHSGAFDTFSQQAPSNSQRGGYQVVSDSQNNAYFEGTSGELGRIDAMTGKITSYSSPAARSQPFSLRIDGQDRPWLLDLGADKVGMFDPIQQTWNEWPVPTPLTAPYDVILDRNGELWSIDNDNDRVERLNTKNGQFVEYPLQPPKEATTRSLDMRRVFVDNSTTPVTVWIGSNHGATLVKFELLD